MARIYGEIAASGLMTFDKSFSRSNGQPLDSTEVFYSLVAAQDYAKTDVAYVGQKIVVVETVDEATTVTHYGVEADGSLKELGAIPVGDGLTVEIVDGKIQLASLEGHTSGTYQPYLVDGKIEWREPSATTVEGLDSRLTTAESDIDELESVVGKAAEGENPATGLVKSVADNAAAIEAIDGKIGEVTEGKTVIEMIADAQAAATYDDTQVKADIKANADAIDAIEADYLKAADKYDDTALVGRVSTVEGDVAAIKGDYLKAEDKTELEGKITTAQTAAEGAQSTADAAKAAIDAFLKEADATETAIDTLKEIQAELDEGEANAATMLAKIQALEAVDNATQAEMDAAIATVNENIGSIEDRVEALEAVDVATKEYADQAEADAKSYADGLNTNMAARVEALEDKAHEHENKTVLDAITAEKVAAWDGAEQNAKDYADGLNTAMGGRVDAVEAALDDKVNVEEGKSLIADTLITKLEGIAAGAQVNVIDSVDEEQFAIDENKKLALLDVAMSKVTGLEDALDGKVDKVEGSRLITSDEATKLGKLVLADDGSVEISAEISAANVKELDSWITTNRDSVLGLLSATKEAKLDGIAEGAQVNIIESVKVGGTVLDVVNKAVDIPVATADVFGVVKSSVDENKVAVATDGTMEVNSVNVNKLVQDNDEVLVLNGGAAV